MVKNINYENKVAIQNDEDIEVVNKVTDTDMNEIKEVVNNNAGELSTAQENISDLKKENETQSTSIEDLQTNLSEAQEEIKALKTIQNALPVIDGEGENVTLKGTAENVAFKKFQISGNSRQETEASPEFPSEIEAVGDDVNLFDRDNAIKLHACTQQATGQIVQSQASMLTYIECESDTTYTIQKINSELFSVSYSNNEPSVGSNFEGRIKYVTAEKGSITTGQDSKYLILEYYRGTEVVSEEEVFNSIKIQKGINTGKWSPFGQGSASETVCNKNMLNLEEIEETIKNGLTYSIKNGVIKLNGTTTNSVQIKLLAKDTVLKNKKYSASLLMKNQSNTNSAAIAINSTGGTSEENRLFYIECWGNNTKIVKKEFSSKQIMSKDNSIMHVNAGFTFNNAEYKIQIEESEEATDYIEHQEQNFTMPCQKEMVTGEDYFDLDTLEEVHGWGKLVFDGVNNKFTQYITAANGSGFRYNGTGWDSTSSIKMTNIKATHFKASTSWAAGTTYGAYTSNGFALQVIMLDKTFTSSGDFNNWAKSENEAGRPLIFYYKLQEPERLPMTTEQIEVAKQIKNTLVSYKDTTHVYSEDSISPIFKCSAIADMTAMFDNMQAQILANEEV